MINLPTEPNPTYKTFNEQQIDNTSPNSQYKSRSYDFDSRKESIPSSTDRDPKSTKASNGGLMAVFHEEESESGTPDMSADKVLCELRGVVVKREDSIIQVKIDDLIIDFPKVLFQGIPSTLKLGQRVRYQVCKKNNGLRFQKFLLETEHFQNPRMQEVVDLIERINS